MEIRFATDRSRFAMSNQREPAYKAAQPIQSLFPPLFWQFQLFFEVHRNGLLFRYLIRQ